MSAVKRRSDMNAAAKKVIPVAASVSENQDERIMSLEQTIEELQEQIRIYEAKESSKSDPLSKHVSEEIIDKLSKAASSGVLNHISAQVRKNLDLVPAARILTLRFPVAEALWIDDNSLHNYVLTEWRKHVKDHLTVDVQDLDDAFVVSLTVPEIKVAARQNKTRSTAAILIDADREL